jgi:hypothetical protein
MDIDSLQSLLANCHAVGITAIFFVLFFMCKERRILYTRRETTHLHPSNGNLYTLTASLMTPVV